MLPIQSLSKSSLKTLIIDLNKHTFKSPVYKNSGFDIWFHISLASNYPAHHSSQLSQKNIIDMSIMRLVVIVL